MSSEVQAAHITFDSGGVEIGGYGARPAGHGPFPGLVLVPDVRGLYDHYEDVARRLAAEGFFTLVVDLYSREGAPELPDLETVFRWIRDLDDRRVLGDLRAAVSYLEAHDLVRSGHVGVTGFCMGGQYALMAACTDARLRACVVWYGMLRYELRAAHKPESPLEMAPRLGCPLLGLYGADDALIPAADTDELAAVLEREGKTFEIVSYPGAGHAFFNDSRPDTYRPRAAADAWPRALAFLHEHLGG